MSSNASKVLSCGFWNDVLCSYRKSEKFGVMDRCLKCRHYERFLRAMAEEDEKVMDESLCPACGEEMRRCVYVGKRHIVKDVGSADYVPSFVDNEFGEDGEPNYIEVV